MIQEINKEKIELDELNRKFVVLQKDITELRLAVLLNAMVLYFYLSTVLIGILVIIFMLRTI